MKQRYFVFWLYVFLSMFVLVSTSLDIYNSFYNPEFLNTKNVLGSNILLFWIGMALIFIGRKKLKKITNPLLFIGILIVGTGHLFLHIEVYQGITIACFFVWLSVLINLIPKKTKITNELNIEESKPKIFIADNTTLGLKLTKKIIEKYPVVQCTNLELSTELLKDPKINLIIVGNEMQNNVSNIYFTDFINKIVSDKPIIIVSEEYLQNYKMQKEDGIIDDYFIFGDDFDWQKFLYKINNLINQKTESSSIA